MANETANRSSAGLIIQFNEDPDPPIILGSWGFIESSIVRLTDTPAGGEDGQYQILLEQPASGHIDLADTFFTQLDSVVVTQSLALPNFIGAALFIDVLTANEAELLALVAAGKPITLPALAMQLTDAAGGALDAFGILNVEVRRVPQQV
jgi:hypothetical protein